MALLRYGYGYGYSMAREEDVRALNSITICRRADAELTGVRINLPSPELEALRNV